MYDKKEMAMMCLTVFLICLFGFLSYFESKETNKDISSIKAEIAELQRFRSLVCEIMHKNKEI